MKKVELLFGCILFPIAEENETNVRIVEVLDLHLVDEDKVDEMGEQYLNDGGDSYLAITDEIHDLIDWDETAKQKYEELKKEL